MQQKSQIYSNTFLHNC